MENNSFADRILVFFSSTGFMLTILGVIASILESEFSIEVIDFFVILTTFVSGIIFILIQHLFVNEKSTAGVHIRFMILYIILILVLSFFLDERNSPYILLPSLILQYYITDSISDVFFKHEIFKKRCVGKSGKTLSEFLFHDNLFVKDLAESLKKNKELLFILSFAASGGILLLKLLGIKIHLYSLISLFAFFLSVFFIYIFTGFYEKESYFSALGISDAVKNKRQILKYGFFILCFSFLIGIITAKNKSLIDVTKFSKFAEKLERTPPAKNQTPAFDIPDFDDDIIGMPEIPIGESIPPHIIELILKILKIIMITVVSLLLIFKFFKPFFSLGWKRFWEESHLKKFLSSVMKEFKDFFMMIFSKEKHEKKNYNTVSSKNFLDSMSEVLRHSDRSKKKKLELDRLTRQFVKLINAGEKHGIKYQKNFAPLEYTALLNLNSADKAAVLFEKALYSKNLLTPNEENSFFESIKISVEKINEPDEKITPAKNSTSGENADL